jgi:hypothetical protein
MKKIKFLTLVLVGLTFSSLMSCSNDDDSVQDSRDQYVGTWNSTTTGSLTLFQNGQSIGTAPLNDSNTISISKSGSNALIIDGRTFTVNGNSLTSTPMPATQTSDGITVVLTVISSGTLGSNIINLNDTITGTWNASTGDSGNLSGNAATTLTKN